MTLNELVYDLWENVRGTIANEDDIDKRQLEFWIHNQRALWLRNDLNKSLNINTSYIQDLGKISLEMVNINLPVDKNFRYLRTTVDIPPLIKRHNKEALIRVGSPILSQIPFDIVDPLKLPYIGNGRYNYNSVYATLIDRRIYILYREKNILFNTINNINVKCILENPTDAKDFTDYDGNICWSDSSEYPISRDLYNYMKAEILKLDLRTELLAPSDTETDAYNNLSINAKTIKNATKNT